MATISELSHGAQTEFVKLRHKYLNGSGEIVMTSGATTPFLRTGTFPDTNFNCVVSARSTVITDAPIGSREIELPSDSEAAKFQVGDSVLTFTTVGVPVSGSVTVEGVKGQKILVSATTTAALVPGQLVVRFATGHVGGQAAGAPAGLPYVNAGDVAAFLQAIQDNITATWFTGTVDIDSLATDEGIYSKFTSGSNVSSASSNTLVGSLFTFATEPAALVGCTARIVAHGTGAATVMTVGDIRDSNGTFLGDQFPVVTTAAHSGGAGTAVTPTTDTTATLTCGMADKYIKQIMGSTATPPAKVAGQENSNDAGATTLLINAMFDMLVRMDPDVAEGAGDSEIVPANLEEKLFGSMTGSIGTSQGKRVLLSEAAASGVSTLTVEKDNAINDIPFPLSGSIRVHTNRGQGNTQGNNVVTLSADRTFTRTKRSNVLTLGAAVGVTCKVGDIVELLPAHGRIMKGYAEQVSGEDLVTLMMKMRTSMITLAEPTIS